MPAVPLKPTSGSGPAENRPPSGAGQGTVGQLRRSNQVPGVLYGHKQARAFKTMHMNLADFEQAARFHNYGGT